MTGALAAWGLNSAGQCDIPAPNAGFAAIAAGAEHSVGLKVFGAVVAWGSNEYGQCAVPAPNADFVAIDAGAYHSLGLKACRGDLNCDGLLNFGDINPFTLYLSSATAWKTAYPYCHALNGDLNHDGYVTFRDINPFVALLSSGSQ
jgi:hypothetical protein